MDSIEVRTDVVYYGRETPFIFVNGERLDMLLARQANDEWLLTLAPSWLDSGQGYPEEEMSCVWSHSRLDEGTKVLPILLCPDDFDFSCTIIVVEVTPAEDTVAWSRFGRDLSGHPKYIGETVEPLVGVGSFVFDRRQYEQCLKTFLTWEPSPRPGNPNLKEPSSSSLIQKILRFLDRFMPKEPVYDSPLRKPNENRRKLAGSLSPWKEKRFLHVGGFLGMGLDDLERFLLTISASGRGVFDLYSGDRVAREYDGTESHSARDVEGIGCLLGNKIPVCGVFWHATPRNLWMEGKLLDNEVTELKAVVQTRDCSLLLVGRSDGVSVFERKND